MVLVLGGRCQGKEAFIKDLFPDVSISNGNTVDYKDISSAEIIINLNGLIMRMIEDNYSNDDITQEIMKFKGSGVSCDIVGSGVVAMDKTLRRYIDLTGRISTLIAEKSSQVYRVTAGIGNRIK